MPGTFISEDGGVYALPSSLGTFSDDPRVVAAERMETRVAVLEGAFDRLITDRKPEDVQRMMQAVSEGPTDGNGNRKLQ